MQRPLPNDADRFTKPTFKIVCEQTNETVSSGHQSVHTSSGVRDKTDIEFARIFMATLEDVANYEMPASAFRLFLLLIAKSNYENKVLITREYAEKHLALHRTTIVEALEILFQYLIIVRSVNDSGVTFYTLNPHLVWKGSEKLRKKSIKAAEEQNRQEVLISLFGKDYVEGRDFDIM